jgi:excisionase family DNA binding protein
MASLSGVKGSPQPSQEIPERRMSHRDRPSFDAEDLDAGFFTVAELAALTRSSTVTIYRQFEKGLIPGTKLGGRIIFSRKKIAAWLTAHSSGPELQKRSSVEAQP